MFWYSHTSCRGGQEMDFEEVDKCVTTKRSSEGSIMETYIVAF